MSIDVAFVLEPGQNIEEQLTEELSKRNSQFRPKRIIVEAPYAEFVEYGTSPNNGEEKGGVDDDKGVVDEGNHLERLIRWVEEKNLAQGSEAKRMAYNIMRLHKEKGMPAQPFFRPALYSTLDSLPEDFFDQPGNTIELILEMAAKKMREIIVDNDTIASGYLYNSIAVESVEDDTVDIQSLSKMANVDGLNGSVVTDDEGLKHIDNIRYGMSRSSLKDTYSKNMSKISANNRSHRYHNRDSNGSRRVDRLSKGPNKRQVYKNAQEKRTGGKSTKKKKKGGKR